MASHYAQDPTVLNFAVRKPVEVTLKYDEPRECSAPGRFFYSLAGNHPGMRMFVSRPVVEQIFTLGVKAGQPFWIEKRGKDDFAVMLDRPETADERLSRQLRESLELNERAKRGAQARENVARMEPEPARKPAAVETTPQPIPAPPVAPEPTLTPERYLWMPNLVEVARSYSFKLNMGNYESRDFFCSQKAECRPEDADLVSDRLYEFCKRQVMKAVAQETGRKSA